MKKKKYIRSLTSIFLVLVLIVGLANGFVHKAYAASSHIWYACIESPDVSFGYVVNKADKCSKTVTLSRGSKQEINGWVLSSIKISSYTIEYTYKGNLAKVQEIPQSDLSVFGATAQSDRDFYAGANKYVKSQLGQNAKFYTENGRWHATLDTKDMATGEWTVTVKARRVGDLLTFSVATIKLSVTEKASSVDDPFKYAVCNSVPNPNTVKHLTVGRASEIKLSTYSVGEIAGATTKIHVDGWALNENGIQSYSYTIIDNKSQKVVGSGKITAYNRTDLAETSNNLDIMTWGHQKNTGYSGNIDISRLNSGKYTAVVTGTTYDNQLFNVANITFSVTRYFKSVWKGPYNEVTRIDAQDTKINISKDINHFISDDYGYHTGWSFDKAGTQMCTLGLTACSNYNLYYQAIPNERKIQFVIPGKSGESVYETVTVKSGEKIEDITKKLCKKIYNDDNMDEPSLSGCVFVGWGKNTQFTDVSSHALFLPDHTFFFEEGQNTLTIQAKFVDISKTSPIISYMVNLKDLQRWDAAYKIVVENAKKLKNQEEVRSFGNKIIALAGDVVGSALNIVYGATIEEIGKKVVTGTVLKLFGWSFGQVTTGDKAKAEYYKRVVEEKNHIAGLLATLSTGNPQTANKEKALVQYQIEYTGKKSLPKRSDPEVKRTIPSLNGSIITDYTWAD